MIEVNLGLGLAQFIVDIGFFCRHRHFLRASAFSENQNAKLLQIDQFFAQYRKYETTTNYFSQFGTPILFIFTTQ